MPRESRFDWLDPNVARWTAAGAVGLALLPWYILDEGLFGFGWLLSGYPFEPSVAPALFLLLAGESPWLWPLFGFLLLGLGSLGARRGSWRLAVSLILAGGGGLAYLLLQGFAIGLAGWEFETLEATFGELDDRQFGMGFGGLLTAAAFLFLLTHGIASRRGAGGDLFVVGAIGFVVAIIALFIFFPISRVLLQAVQTNEGVYSLGVFWEKLTDRKIWGLACLVGEGSCGVAWNSLALAVLVGLLTTLLGLAFALVATRSGLHRVGWLKALTVLPIITPPFVIGLAIILLFGLSGAVTQFVADLFGGVPTRWVYGMPGILIAQVLAFTPIAFLVLIGVVEGVSPSMEEAAQTLRADRWSTFRTVSLPLMRPGLANAFLLGFIESMADFGNPLVLGGNFDVLSTEIFFAIVGAQYDEGRAAVLALVLLGFTLIAFYLQRFWLGRKSYATVAGKGDAGLHPRLPARLRIPVYATVAIWTLFTLTVYAMIVFGSFVELWGVNHDLTFKHYLTAFDIDRTPHGLHLSGSAWDSFLTTLQVAAVSAPLTAAVGLVTAYLLVRQRFPGKDAFEFGAMLSFAIPGTVIGVSYILAFNVPPIELTGTGTILVISFVFRNMPVGIRAGVAAMSQLDRSLDESSMTLGASVWSTFRHVVLPLLRPAILAALVFSFVRAMTAISAVIFLVSAEYDMATTYIIGRVENNDYGLAIAYATVLIVVMLFAVAGFQLLVGERRLGRRRAEAERAGVEA